MSEFDKENEDVFQIVHDNPRRRGVIRNVGYIISEDQANRFAAYEAAQNRGGVWVKDIAFMCISVLAVICITIAAII